MWFRTRKDVVSKMKIALTPWKVVEPSTACCARRGARSSLLPAAYACGVGRSPTLLEAISMHSGLASHVRKVQAAEGSSAPARRAAARCKHGCSLQPVPKAPERRSARKCAACQPGRPPRSKSALPAGPGGAALQPLEQLVCHTFPSSSNCAQLCTSCLPVCLLHAEETRPDARCMWLPAQLPCACPDPC